MVILSLDTFLLFGLYHNKRGYINLAMIRKHGTPKVEIKKKTRVEETYDNPRVVKMVLPDGREHTIQIVD